MHSTHVHTFLSRTEFIEVEALHGYRTVLWTGNAKRALQLARDRLIATVCVVDVIEDILEWMLEVRRPLSRRSTGCCE
jgi:hypothetical protein